MGMNETLWHGHGHSLSGTYRYTHTHTHTHVHKHKHLSDKQIKKIEQSKTTDHQLDECLCVYRVYKPYNIDSRGSVVKKKTDALLWCDMVTDTTRYESSICRGRAVQIVATKLNQFR